MGSVRLKKIYLIEDNTKIQFCGSGSALILVCWFWIQLGKNDPQKRKHHLKKCIVLEILGVLF
jgi:hypothetical protein